MYTILEGKSKHAGISDSLCWNWEKYKNLYSLIYLRVVHDHLDGCHFYTNLYKWEDIKLVFMKEKYLKLLQKELRRLL